MTVDPPINIHNALEPHHKKFIDFTNKMKSMNTPVPWYPYGHGPQYYPRLQELASTDISAASIKIAKVALSPRMRSMMLVSRYSKTNTFCSLLDVFNEAVEGMMLGNKKSAFVTLNFVLEGFLQASILDTNKKLNLKNDIRNVDMSSVEEHFGATEGIIVVRHLMEQCASTTQNFLEHHFAPTGRDVWSGRHAVAHFLSKVEYSDLDLGKVLAALDFLIEWQFAREGGYARYGFSYFPWKSFPTVDPEMNNKGDIGRIRHEQQLEVEVRYSSMFGLGNLINKNRG